MDGCLGCKEVPSRGQQGLGSVESEQRFVSLRTTPTAVYTNAVSIYVKTEAEGREICIAQDILSLLLDAVVALFFTPYLTAVETLERT